MTKYNPDFKTQVTETDAESRRVWIREQAALAKSAGCTWTRVTSQPGDLTTILFEGWKVRPKEEVEPVFKEGRGK